MSLAGRAGRSALFAVLGAFAGAAPLIGADGQSGLDELPSERIVLETRANGRHEYRAWRADTPETRGRGLMYVAALTDDQAMIFVYEHDALKYLNDRALEDPRFRPTDYSFLYPDPGVISRHMFVGRQEASRLGEILVKPSSELQRIMARSFFLRGTDGGALFEESVRRRGLAGCVRPGGGESLDAPNPSSAAAFPGADRMAEWREAIVKCSG